MILMIFLDIITLLDNLRRDLKVKWLSLCCENTSPLLFCTKIFSVDYILDTYSLMS